MAITAKIKTAISGTVEFAFDDAESLKRLLDVLDGGLEQNKLFNEDIQEFADNIREILNNV